MWTASQLSTAALLILSVIFQVLCIETQYPNVRRDEGIIDDYHGVKVKDPYRWLEDDSFETSEFVAQQNALSKNFLTSIPDRKIIREKLISLVNYERFSAPIKKQGRYFHFYNNGLQDHDILLKQDDLYSEPEVLLDPNLLSDDGSIALSPYYYQFSEDGKKFVYALSKNGSDWLEGHIKDIDTSQDLLDTLEFIKWPDFSFTRDSQGLFYSRFPVGDDGLPINSHPQIYYHKLGTIQSDDIFIVDNADNFEWFLMAEVSSCGDFLIVKPQPDFKSNSVVITSLKNFNESNPHPIPEVDFLTVFSAEQEQARFIYVVNTENDFIFLSDKDAPNYQLIRLSIDIDSQEISNKSILVPEHEKNILKWVKVIDEDKLLLCYFEDVKHKLEVRFLTNGSLLHKIELPTAGVISDYSLYRENNEFFFKFENLVSPGTIYRCTFEQNLQFGCQIFKEIVLSNQIDQKDLSNFTMTQVFYPSKDGTQIPMYIAHKQNISMAGIAPTLLFGYGGFNVDLLPTFSPFTFAFIDYFDGVYAAPNIRGGAEYGEPWHEAGTVLKKQNSFDDFQYAAEYLIQMGYTKSEKIAIQGSSNGGLLVGVCVNQRPDLYGVALPDVGLMDMLRFQKSAIGFAWCSEYGCSDNETHFHNLYKYSPLHNIAFPDESEGGLQYPALLASTADHDNRVLPSHSYKYIAELQYTIGSNLAQTNPFLLRVAANAGHSGDGTPLLQQIEDYADSYAFVAEKFRQHRSSSSVFISVLMDMAAFLTTNIFSFVSNNF